MRRRDEPALYQSSDDRLRSGHKLPSASLTGSLSGRFPGRQYKDWQRLVRLPDQGDDLCPRSPEADPADIQQIFESRERGNDAFDQGGMATEETLPRVGRILEIWREQEKLRLWVIWGRHEEYPFLSLSAKPVRRSAMWSPHGRPTRVLRWTWFIVDNLHGHRALGKGSMLFLGPSKRIIFAPRPLPMGASRHQQTQLDSATLNKIAARRFAYRLRTGGILLTGGKWKVK